MTTIYKYPLAITDSQVLLLPTGAKILSAQMQGPSLCLWALVNTNTSRTDRRLIEIAGTGNPLPELAPAIDRTFISTAQMGALVWHVFEITPR